MRKPLIAPSILSADFSRLGEDMRTAEQAGADRFHIDVMDGHFVPNISLGPVVIESVRKITPLPFDVHLMISDPDRYLEAFAKAGSNLIIAHIEASPNIGATVDAIHQLGCEAGVAVSPDTHIDALRTIAPRIELILIMSVYPGFSGQKFIEGSIDRVRQTREMLNACNSDAMIALDGGVDVHNIGRAVAAGADNLIAATSIYRAGIPISDAIHQLRHAANAHH
jgi:ribulose-phosphate 3-epimerase